LAGGRNKLVASKAYEFYNGELEGTGLHINTPETIHDLSKAEIPLWVNSFGGHAVVKVSVEFLPRHAFLLRIVQL
jgi:hypothetical protein